MNRLIQPSFARGEIGSDLYGRVDVAAYSVALRTAINLVIHAYGGASNRAGLKYVGPCSVHSGDAPRLVEFSFNTTDTYILEFGDQTMRVVRNDAHVLNAAQTITGVTQADPGVVTATGHGFSDGDDVYVTGVAGMTELNDRWFTVANKTANTFELTSQQTGANVDTSGYTAYSSGGTASSVYEIATPYAIADVAQLKTVQSANVMTIAHASYAPRELSRNDHDDWTLSEITFEPAQDHHLDVSVTSNSGSGTNTYYRVTATNETTGEESLPALDVGTVTVSGATQANPCVVTTSSHGWSTGDEVELNDIVGMTELNGRRFTITVLTGTTFSLDGEDSTGHTAYSSGGEGSRTFSVVSGGATPNNTVSWTAAEGAVRYSVYRLSNGLYGWLGDTETTSFVDNNIDPDLSLTPPRASNPFFGSGNYPRAVSYYEQRRVFGGTDDDRDTTWYSVVGSQSNMSHAVPRQPDDSITATLNSLEVNEIRGFVPLNDLIVLTSGAEWRVNSGSENAFTAENLRQKPQSNWGSSYIDPIVIGDKVLFFTENDTYVRSLGYEITIDGYRGSDMTVFAPHLFRDYCACQAAFSQWPDPLVAVVREDGWGAVLTFNPEQEVVAWARWNTAGKFKTVASTRPSSGDVDKAHYFVVERTIGGSSAYYIERVADRRFTDVRDCFFVDSGRSLDDAKTITGATSADPVVITAASHGFSDGDEVDLVDITWEPDVDAVFTETQPDQLNNRRYYVADQATNTFALVQQSGRLDVEGATQANPCVVTITGHGLADGDKIGIFNVAGMTQLNGKTYEVANKTADTFELSGVDSSGYGAYTSGGQVYPCEDGSAFNAYREGGEAREATDTISGLWHLEGREVVMLADGNVVSGKTVSNGQVTLDSKASRVHAGLRYVADFETLNPEIAVGGSTIQGKSLRVPVLTVRLKDTRGLLAGPGIADLEEMKQREFEKYGEPTQLLTGDKELHIPSDWEGEGRVFLRQVNPLPLTVTAVIPHLDVGDEDEDE